MNRRTLATLTIIALGAAAASACSGPLPSGGTGVETRQSALSTQR